MQIPYTRLICGSVFATLAVWALGSIVAQIDEPGDQLPGASPAAEESYQRLERQTEPQETRTQSTTIKAQPAYDGIPQPAMPPRWAPTKNSSAASEQAPNVSDSPLEEERLDMQPTQSEELKALILAQLKDVRTQDLSKAYYAYTTSDFQKIVPLETFKIFMRTSPGFANNRAFEMQNISFTGVVAAVKGILIDANEQQTSVQYNFMQENGLWKIRKLEVFAPSGQVTQ